MDDIKKAYVWHEALELSKRLVQICEEFSDADTNVLVWHLRNSVVDIPSTIAADLQANRWATMEPVIKLATALELVRKIYPAIETGPTEEQLATLMKRMQSELFSEREPEPEPEELEGAEKQDPGKDIEKNSDEKPASPSRVDGVQHAVTSIDPPQPATILPIHED